MKVRIVAFMIAVAAASATAADSSTNLSAKLPLHFEPATEISGYDFIARPAGHFAAVSADEALFAFRTKAPTDAQKRGGFEDPQACVSQQLYRLKLENANPAAVPFHDGRLAGNSNYLIGTDESQWRRGVPHFEAIGYTDIYPGIDVRYHGNQRQLEFDFHLAANTDPGRIRMHFDGAPVDVDAAGDLVVGSGSNAVRLARPVAYQDLYSGRKEVAAAYKVMANGRVGFELGEYDTKQPLIVDPILRYSTFLGGTGDDEAHAVAVDSTGNVYVTGFTYGGFPVKAGGYDTTYNTNGDVFVTKINPAVGGTGGIVFSTYIGGSAFEEGNGIAVDASGVYVAGNTASTNYPRTGLTGTVGGTDAFVTKLNSSGTGIIYSRKIAGTNTEVVSGIAVGADAGAVICGRTSSRNYPVTFGAYQQNNFGSYDGFVTKVSGTGQSIVFSTYLGGLANDQCLGIALDSDGRAYVTGNTISLNFPTTYNRYQPFNAGGDDAFVTKFNFNGTGLVYSTYFGGSGLDVATAVTVDQTQSISIAGYTGSANFPLRNSGQNYGGAEYDAFVTRFLPDNSGLAFSTYLGGNGQDFALALTNDFEGNLYIAGDTFSTNFPRVNEFDSTYNGSGDAFVTKMNSAGTLLNYSAILGGSGSDTAYGIAVGAAHETYIAGVTESGSGFPTAGNPAQATPNSQSEAFMARLSPTWSALASETFASPASTNGWYPAGLTDPTLVGYDYDAVNQALRVRVYSSPTDQFGNATRYRIAAYVTEDLPYSFVGPDNYVRAKYWVYATEQASPSQRNQIPNFRLRAAVGFAQTTFLEVNHHSNADLGNNRYSEELRPSTDPARPSLYRVDFDPIDVPYLVQNAATMRIMQGFEALSFEPQENGVIALAETSIGTYPASRLPDDNDHLVKVYAPAASDAGDLRVFNSSELERYNLYYPPGSPEGANPVREDTNIGTYNQGSFGITMDTSNVPADRIGVISRYFNPDRSTQQFSQRPRVSEGKQWKVRYHMTSTQFSARQAFIVIRGRSINFAWNQSLDLGGAFAPPQEFAQQMLPGVGSQNPDKITNENGGWYTFIMHSPLDNDIRPEFSPEVTVAERMPDIADQPGPGVSFPSRRDLMFGADLIDTLDYGPGTELELGNVTIDRIEVREYDLIDD